MPQKVNFSSMCLFPKNGQTKFVRVVGMQGDFPFYGELETDPSPAGLNYQKLGGALVDATVMIQFDLQAGDSIKVGELTFPIIGALKSAPGSGGFNSAIAPAVYLPYSDIEGTGLIQTGSRLEYQYYFVADPTMDLEKLNEELDPILDAEEADLDTHIDTSQRIGSRYDNFIMFLNLVAFVALLLGCIGIASSVHIYIKEKLKSVAILKCLGASRKQTFVLFLIQIFGMGIAGGILGSIFGFLLQETFPILFAELLPFDIETQVSPEFFIMGLLLGILMSVLFALIPLLGTWYVSPLRVLRIQDGETSKSKRAVSLVSLLIFAFVFIFSFWILQDWKYAFFFLIGILITFAVLTGISALFIQGVKRFFPSSWDFCSRQSLLNLFRPQNQTLVLILTIGVGTFLISTLYFTKDMLLSKLSFDSGGNVPNIILLDVQNDQKEDVAQSLDKVIDNIPIVTMRVHSINGRLSNDIRKDTASGINEWMLNHEFRVTYRDSLIASEEIIEGEWIPEQKYNPSQPVDISISESIARDGKVSVGDSLIFNVQGVLMKTKVASIRAVDWSRMQLNFSLVFPKGILENAPQFNVLTTNTPDDQSSARLQSELITKFPNISILDMRQMLRLIDQVLTKISWVINFMAIFSIITGIIVLIGAIRNSKFQRIRENVLLRTLGATNKQILKIVSLEYLYLGVLGSLSGILLSLLGSQILAWSVFDMTFAPSYFPFVVLFPGITVLVLIVGLSNSKSVLKSPPLEVLRKETH